jgi:hypothetical protein
MKGIDMKHALRTIAAGVALMVLLIFGTMTSRAQGNAATLTGTVVDKTGAVIPRASIVVTDEASGVIRTATSDGRGFFSLIGVPVATYDVEISAKGFNSLRRNGVAVHINDQIELKGIVLTVAGASFSVMVTADAAELTPTTSGEVSYTITDTQLHNMNLEGRSAIELLGLVPGAGNTGNFTTQSYNGNQAGFTQNASAFTVNGNRFDQVQIVSDGASVTDLQTAGGASVTPNVEMIAELKVQSSAYSAAEPNGPIVVTTQTKSGGRTFHGEAYLSARNYNMGATDWQNLTNGLPKSKTSLYYPGVNIGGPVLWPGVSRDHQKLFFFASSEIAQQHVDQGVRKGVVPTAATSPGANGHSMRNGDFSNVWDMDLSNAANGYEYWPVATYPCGGGQSYCGGNGIIAPSSIDPAGKILINAFPLPNVDPLLHGGNNLITDFTTSDPRNQEMMKMDYAFSDNVHSFVRYNHENESVPWPYGPYNQWNQVPYPAAQTGKNASNSVLASLTNVLNPSLTNEFSAGYTRFTLKQALANLDTVSRTALNYPYANLFTSSSDLIPNVDFEGSGQINNNQLYINGGEAPPYLGAQNNYTVNDNLTKVWGKHLFKFGFFGQLGRFNLLTTGNDNGSVTTDTYTGVSGNDWADLLMGFTSGFTQSSANIEAGMVNKRFDFFAQDTWKATSKLTLNYGMRLDHIGWWYDSKGRITIFNPAAYVAGSALTAYTGMQSHATNSSVPLSGFKPLSFQVAPSVGFAYDLSGNGKTVVRGGFGTNYYIDPGQNSFSAMLAPPNFKVVTLYASQSNPANSTNTGSTIPYTLSGISSLDFSTTLPTVWGTANPADSHAPVTYSWNLAVSHAFPWSSKVEANYVGNVSRNLVGYGTQNAVPQGKETGPYYGTYYDQLYRPYANYGDIKTAFHNLNSNYNALQVTVTRQKGWLNYWASYTYGKSLAYNAEDSFDMKRWYGPTPFDRSQILSFSYYMTLPNAGKHLGNHKPVNGVVNGWHLSGIFQAMPGGPISNNFGSEYAANRNTIGIYASADPNYKGTIPNFTAVNWANYVPSSYGAYATGTPDEVAVPVLTCDPRKGLAKNQYFNPACFAGPGNLSNGAYRLPYIHGPAFINDSTGVFKTFGMGASRKLEIRGEVFNIFNHPWNEFLASDPRMYMGFYWDTGALSSTGIAGTSNNKTGHRQVQLAAKYYF